MKKYSLVFAASVLVLFGAGCSSAPSTSSSATVPANQPPAAQNPAGTSPTTQAAENVVTYTDSGWSPSSITIRKGDTVIFKNTASDAMRVASNPHPVHTGYPTTGGCVGSTFDSCANIAPGSSWSFTFDFVGSWGYHNHMNPSEMGTVVVQQ